MPRKIMQIAATPDTESDYLTLFARCDDGTIWFLADPSDGNRSNDWTALPDVPQPEDTDDAEA